MHCCPPASAHAIACGMHSSDMKIPSGNMVAAARHAAGLSQSQLARAAGVDASTVSRMETCGTEPVGGKVSNLHAVLEALRRHGVELEEDAIRIVKRGRR
jgi:transcriptional regulator with XRE-family HTH domain